MTALLIALFSFGDRGAAWRSGAAPAKTPPAQTPRPRLRPCSAPAPPADYQVGPQDVLNITVFGEPQLSGKVRIDNDGTFPFQYLGRVKADDLTVAEIGSELLRKGLGGRLHPEPAGLG